MIIELSSVIVAIATLIVHALNFVSERLDEA